MGEQGDPGMVTEQPVLTGSGRSSFTKMTLVHNILVLRNVLKCYSDNWQTVWVELVAST